MSLKTRSNQVPSRWHARALAVREAGFRNRRSAATAGVAALALMLGYHVVFGQNGLLAFRHKRQVEQQLQSEMRELQTENDKLRGHVARLENDPGAIEHQAREELHYTRAGEVIYTLPNEKASTAKVPDADKQ